ncbi:MAG: hypothetical protein A2X12_05195 [Bacteroidetes bacterium GWE2_29_8]|nr:MAG: hypothetical protein A2X12_05195 [Bacteroidetes bacterium GWE2_29_8]OFY15555.1 MAG: hypothetical protein A2X02_04190 [Bacteroidetes bacterium GWF2_29_10]
MIYKLIKKIVIFLNVISALGLFLSYSASYVSPEISLFIAFFGIAYPIFLILNIFFIIYWIITLKIYFLLSLFSILVGYNHIFNIYQPDKQKSKINLANSLKIMSFNVQTFDYYNRDKPIWQRDAILDFIKNEKPDIICLQEYYSNNLDWFDNSKSIKNNLNIKYYKASFTKYIPKKKFKKEIGLAIFSRHPIIGFKILDIDTTRNKKMMYCDILYKSDTIRIFNVHLESIRFGKEDYMFIEEINDKTNNANYQVGIANIYQKLKRGFTLRTPQVNILTKYINNTKTPYIVCGDFNDTPTSYTYHQIAKNNKDAFVESGEGIAQTYIGKFPSFKIDHIIYSNAIKSYNFKIHKDIYLSDHFPISCYIKLKK